MIMMDTFLTILPPVVASLFAYAIATKKAKITYAKNTAEIQLKTFELINSSQEKMREEMKLELDSFKEKNDSMKEEIFILKKIIESNKNEIEILKGQLKNSNDVIDALKSRIKEMTIVIEMYEKRFHNTKKTGKK